MLQLLPIVLALVLNEVTVILLHHTILCYYYF